MLTAFFKCIYHVNIFIKYQTANLLLVLGSQYDDVLIFMTAEEGIFSRFSLALKRAISFKTNGMCACIVIFNFHIITNTNLI